MSDEEKKKDDQTEDEKKKIPPIIIGAKAEKTEQNGKPNSLKIWLIILIPIGVAVIGALGFIIAAYIPTRAPKEPAKIDVNVYIRDAATEKNIPGVIFIDDDKNPTTINPETGTIVPLKEGQHIIQAESKGYQPNKIEIDRLSNPLIIPLEKIAVISDGPIPLSFAGWRPWNDEITLSEGAASNEIIITGATDDATGFSNTSLPPVLRGKTLILYFSNTRASRFSLNRMVKLEYNRNDTLLRPTNASLLNREYLPAEDTPLNNGIEFPIKDDFDGKINFVFYQATLNGLKITAYYQ